MCLRGVLLLFAAAFLSLSIAKALASEILPHQSTVDELLRLDSQAALLAARKNIFGVTQQTQSNLGADAQAQQSHQVLAIYGVGKILTAEVLLDSEPHVFKNSRARPIWGPSLLYRLERIVPPCVYLKKTGQTYTMCLHKGL